MIFGVFLSTLNLCALPLNCYVLVTSSFVSYLFLWSCSPVNIGHWLLIQLQWWPMALCHTFKSLRAQWNFRLSRATAIAQHTEVALSHFPPAWALNEAFVTLSLTLSHPPFLSRPLCLSLSTPTLLSLLINEGAKSQQWSSHPLWPWMHPSMSLFQVCLRSQGLNSYLEQNLPSCGSYPSLPSPPRVWDQGSSRTEVFQPAPLTSDTEGKCSDKHFVLSRGALFLLCCNVEVFS